MQHLPTTTKTQKSLMGLRPLTNLASNSLEVVARESFVNGIKKLADDYQLCAEIGQTVQNFLVNTYRNATIEQKLDIANCFDLKAGFTLQDCSMMISKGELEQTDILNFIAKGLQGLCENFGIEFSGSIRNFSIRLLQNYGGLNIIDWIKFYDQAASGMYKKQYESISTRGLTPEFVLAWLDKFVQEKELVNVELRNQQKNQVAGKSIVQVTPKEGANKIKIKGEMKAAPVALQNLALEIEGSKEKAKQVKILEMRADTIRAEHKGQPDDLRLLVDMQELTEEDKAAFFDKMARQSLKKFKNWMIIHQLQILHQQSTFDELSELASSLLKEFKAAWLKEYDAIQQMGSSAITLNEKSNKTFVQFAAFKANQIKYSFRAIRVASDELRVRILEYMLSKGLNNEQVYQQVFGVAYHGKKPILEINQNYLVSQIAKLKIYGNPQTATKGFLDNYVDYLIRSIESNQVPLKKEEFLMLSARKYAQRMFGNDSCVAFMEVVRDIQNSKFIL